MIGSIIKKIKGKHMSKIERIEICNTPPQTGDMVEKLKIFNRQNNIKIPNNLPINVDSEILSNIDEITKTTKKDDHE